MDGLPPKSQTEGWMEQCPRCPVLSSLSVLNRRSSAQSVVGKTPDHQQRAMGVGCSLLKQSFLPWSGFMCDGEAGSWKQGRRCPHAPSPSSSFLLPWLLSTLLLGYFLCYYSFFPFPRLFSCESGPGRYKNIRLPTAPSQLFTKSLLSPYLSTRSKIQYLPAH